MLEIIGNLKIYVRFNILSFWGDEMREEMCFDEDLRCWCRGFVSCDLIWYGMM